MFSIPFVSLPLLFGMVWGGCRENPPLGPMQGTTPNALTWTAGEVMMFDTWSLDSLGYTLPSSKCVSSRRVISTGQTIAGRTSVVVMVDSIALPGRPFRSDTLYFSQTSNGDLWAYGYLAAIGRRYNGYSVGPAWDLLAELSAGNSASWTAGYADTTGAVLGDMTVENRYFSATIGGVGYIIQALRIDLYSSVSGLTFWLSTSPSLFPEIIEPSSSTFNGVYRSLTAVQPGR
jgi:hypothetical protein